MPIYTVSRQRLILDVLENIIEPSHYKHDREKFLEIVKRATGCIDVRPAPGRIGKFIITYKEEG